MLQMGKSILVVGHDASIYAPRRLSRRIRTGYGRAAKELSPLRSQPSDLVIDLIQLHRWWVSLRSQPKDDLVLVVHQFTEAMCQLLEGDDEYEDATELISVSVLCFMIPVVWKSVKIRLCICHLISFDFIVAITDIHRFGFTASQRHHEFPVRRNFPRASRGFWKSIRRNRACDKKVYL